MPRRLDLDALAPEPIILRFRGVDYPIAGTLPVPLMMTALQLRARFVGSATDETAIESVERLYEFVMRLVREESPDAPDLLLGAEDLFRIIDALLGGDGSDVDATLADQLGVPEELRQEPGAAGAADAAPLRAAKPSQRASSRSAGSGRGRRGTGTA